MDGAQLKTLADLNFIARRDYKPAEPLLSRMIAFTQALSSRDSGMVRGFVNANRADVSNQLGMMAATKDGEYWKGQGIFDAFSGEFGVAVAIVPPPGQTPAPNPPAPPSPAPGGSVDLNSLTVDQLKALAQKLAPYLPAPFPTSATQGVTVEGEGTILLAANLNGEERQEKMRHVRRGIFQLNGWDNGMRSHQNWRHSGTDRLPYAVFGGNSRGSFESNWFPAAGEFNADPVPGVDYATVQQLEDPNHPMYDIYRGQGFIVDQGSQPVTEYGTSALDLTRWPRANRRRTMIGTQRKGWPLVFVVSPIRPNGLPVNWGVAWCDSDGSPNPWHFVVDGALRRFESYELPDGRRGICYRP